MLASPHYNPHWCHDTCQAAFSSCPQQKAFQFTELPVLSLGYAFSPPFHPYIFKSNGKCRACLEAEKNPIGALLSQVYMWKRILVLHFSDEDLLYLVDTLFESQRSWFIWFYERACRCASGKRPNYFHHAKSSEVYQHLGFFYLLL